jgi:D-serine deaminase-like pyridoxal phosphate-dependent protein
VRTRSGDTHEHHLHHQRGGAEWPMSAEDVHAKFTTNAATALPETTTTRLTEAILDIEAQPNLTALRALATATPQT